MTKSTLPFVSVIVCTRNRSAHLKAMLESLEQIDIPSDLKWELIIVDNGSSDDTPSVARSFEGQLPVKCVREETAGLSHARNTGVKEATGDYICWTDDDVRLDSKWLSAYVDAFKAYPDAHYFGGRVSPVYEGASPQWLTDNLDMLGTAFAQRELGPQTRKMTGENGDSPYGANFAVKGEDQRRHLFPTHLGVSPKFKRIGEETAVIRAIRREGKYGVWVTDSQVHHIIPNARQSLDYIFSYRQAVGETWIVLEERGEDNFMGIALNGKMSGLAGAPLWIWKKTIIFGLKYRLAKLFSPSSVWLDRLMTYGYYRGALRYLMQRHRSTKA